MSSLSRINYIFLTIVSSMNIVEDEKCLISDGSMDLMGY